MSKVLVQRLWCDPCQNAEDPEDVEGETYIAGIWVNDVMVPKEVELCKEHSDAPHTEVMAWAADYGRDHHPEPKGTPSRVKPPPSTSVYKKARGSERLQCPHCTETRATPGRMDRHIERSHPGEPLGTG